MLASKLASAQQSTHRGFMPSQPYATIGLTGRCRGCIDPALSAQIRLLKHKPQRGSSCPAPDVDAGGCKSGSSRQSHDWRVVASRTGGGARIGP